MLLKQFKRTGPLTIFLIVLILLFMWTGPVISMKNRFALYFDIDSMPLYALVSIVTGTHPVSGIIFSVLLVSAMAFLMVNLNTSLFFINERTFLPALFYILTGGLFPQYQLMNPAIFGALFLMLAIKRIMESYRIQGTAYNFFDAGMLIGTGTLFYANLIWFGIITIIGISLLRTWDPREIVLSLVGLVTPFILAMGIYYVSGNLPYDFIYLLDYNLFGRTAEYAFNPLIVVAVLTTGSMAFLAIAHLFVNIGTKKIQSRKTFALLLWILVASIIIFLVVPSVSVEMIWIAAIPVSYFLTHYFIFIRRKLVPEILFILFFALILFLQVWYLWII